MARKNYFSEGSDAALALEGMMELSGTVSVLYAMSHIMRRKGAVFRAVQLEACAGELGMVPDEVLEFTARTSNGRVTV